MVMMKVNIQTRKLIKPSKPTPSNLRTYNISLIDELNPSMHVIRILYFPYNSDHDIKVNYASFEQSLARVLPLFYPLAGRYDREKHHVDCNDEGAEYAVAEIDCQLHQLIGSAEPEQLNQLLPLDICAADKATDPMLAVQINKFQCGGHAIGVCASHRIFDSASLGLFLEAWANSSNASDRLVTIRPDFDSPFYFPSENLPPLQFQVSRARDKSIVTERLVFDKSAISRLRERLMSSDQWNKRSNVFNADSVSEQRPPSRVVVVSAILTQALLRADRAKHGKQRGSVIAQAINVRERTVPPVPKHSCGTWVSLSYLEFGADESHCMEKDFPGMALKMREATVRGVRDCARILSDKQFGRWVLVDSYFDAAEKADGEDYKVVWVTDWSKFGDYQLDFGFGKPIWVSLADVPLKDLFILMNTKDNDGIEAWVYLHESDMPFFLEDEDLQSLTATAI